MYFPLYLSWAAVSFCPLVKANISMSMIALDHTHELNLEVEIKTGERIRNSLTRKLTNHRVVQTSKSTKFFSDEV